MKLRSDEGEMDLANNIYSLFIFSNILKPSVYKFLFYKDIH